MKRLPETIKISVEALTKSLLQQKSIRQHFRLMCTEEQCYDLLLGAYKAEVSARSRVFTLDQGTETNLRAMAKALCSGDKFGIMLCGTCGNGKTTMLLAFRDVMNYLNSRGMFEDEDPKGIRIVDAKDVKDMMLDPQARKKLRNEPMLAIEDMGREAAEVMDYGNIYSPMIDLVEYRYQEMLFTFITTNLAAKQFREKYGDRIADRMNEMMSVIIHQNETSYRR